MKFKFKFTSVEDLYGNGFSAYIDENNDLVICESWPHEGGETFRGKCFAEVSDVYKAELEKRAPTLFYELSTYNYKVTKSDIELEQSKFIEEMFKDIAEAPTGGVDENFKIRPLKDQFSDMFIRILAGHLVANGWVKEDI